MDSSDLTQEEFEAQKSVKKHLSQMKGIKELLASENGKHFFEYLEKFCGQTETIYSQKDPNAIYILEGRRQVYLHLKNLKETDMESYEKRQMEELEHWRIEKAEEDL